jgi:WD40 repeat protein
LEIFSDDGRNNFLIFEKDKMPSVYQKLESMTTVFQTSQTELVAGIKPSANVEEGPSRFLWFSGEKSLAQKWENGEISNFQYLMHLNTLAGRTYNDLMQYPIFPWIIADYESETLDLTNPKTFRDLSKPMGAQTEDRMMYYTQKYKEEAWEPTFNEPEHFHYRIHYCSAMTVASYLIRMEPYTQYFIHLQDGHFDRADRAFNSIEMAWKSASGEDRNDIREVIPEFYYLPDFLTNSNQFVLGCKQNGTVIGDVILPPWAKGDPREFIRIQREALESDYVSAHLHEWIDLIFGYKQSGPAAVDACNVFHPYFYEQNVRDIDKMDARDRGAALSIIHHFGQMPKQILTRPHRQKRVPLSVTPSSDLAVSSSSRYFYKDIAALELGKDITLKVRNEVGQIIAEKGLTATEKYKILIPPNYTKYFAWHYDDHSARLCSVEQDKTLGVFEGLQNGQILCAAAVNSNVIVTAGDSTVVCVWELRKEAREKGKLSMQLTKVLYGHTDPVLCLGVSKTFQIIVSGSADSTCIIWDLNKLSFIQQLCPNSGSITALAINSQTGDIVTCTRTSVHLWTINGQLIVSTTIVQMAYSSITCCAMTELVPYDKDNVIVVGCSDGGVRILSLVYDSEMKKKKEHSRRSESEEDVSKNGNVSKARVSRESSSPLDKEEGSSSSDRPFSPVRIINLEAWEAHREKKQSLNLCLQKTLKVSSASGDKNTTTAKVTAVCISKDHKKLYVGDSLGRVYTWTTGESG